jgi:hypothetical protein
MYEKWHIKKRFIIRFLIFLFSRNWNCFLINLTHLIKKAFLMLIVEVVHRFGLGKIVWNGYSTDSERESESRYERERKREKDSEREQVWERKKERERQWEREQVWERKKERERQWEREQVWERKKERGGGERVFKCIRERIRERVGQM